MTVSTIFLTADPFVTTKLSFRVQHHKLEHLVIEWIGVSEVKVTGEVQNCIDCLLVICFLGHWSLYNQIRCVDVRFKGCVNMKGVDYYFKGHVRRVWFFLSDYLTWYIILNSSVSWEIFVICLFVFGHFQATFGCFYSSVIWSIESIYFELLNRSRL